MKKCLCITIVLIMILSCLCLVACDKGDVNGKYYDSITKTLKLSKDFQGKSFKADGIGEATLAALTDGDTTRFTLSDGEDVVIRYYCVDTPESTGGVEKWGKAASLFVKDRLSNATQIVLESTTGGRPEVDKYGSRLLGYVWYKTADYKDFKLLNLEIIENGFSENKALNTDKYPYYKYMDEATKFAKKTMLRIYSTKDDPLYSDDPIRVTIKEFLDNVDQYYNAEKDSGAKIIFNAYLIDLTISKSGTYTFTAGEYDKETGSVNKINVYAAYTSNPASKMKLGHLYTIIGNIQNYNGAFQVSGIVYNPRYQDKVPNGSFIIQKDYYLTFDSTEEYFDNYSATLYSDVTVVSSEVKEGVLTIVGSTNKRTKDGLGEEKQFTFTVDVPDNYANNLTAGSKFSVCGYQLEANSGKIVIPRLSDITVK